MKVFNLLETPLHLRGGVIPPGKSCDYPELDTFLPDREKALIAKGIISLRTLPKGWGEKAPPPAKPAVRQPNPLIPPPNVEPIDIAAKPVEEKSWKRRK